MTECPYEPNFQCLFRAEAEAKLAAAEAVYEADKERQAELEAERDRQETAIHQACDDKRVLIERLDDAKKMIIALKRLACERKCLRRAMKPETDDDGRDNGE